MSLPGNWKTEELIALTTGKGLTYTAQIAIVNDYNSLNDFLDKSDSLSAKFRQGELFGSNSNSETLDKAGEQTKYCLENNLNIVTYWDKEYPFMLKNISQPPVVLFIKGKLDTNGMDSISIVGTRRATHYGKAADKFASYFVEKGLIVTSGLAYGIDTACHLAAVNSGGITYAVIACGLDKISPEISSANADKIAESGGAVISEYKIGTTARPGYFPQRNRIISGISKALLVIESAEKGGSMITAGFALDQGREVFALPGSIYSERSAGCNKLIYKSEAAIAISPRQILEDIGMTLPGLEKETSRRNYKFNSPEEKKIFDVLGHEPVQIDEIFFQTGLEIPEILVKLLELEFKNYIKQLPGKFYIRN